MVQIFFDGVIQEPYRCRIDLSRKNPMDHLPPYISIFANTISSVAIKELRAKISCLRSESGTFLLIEKLTSLCTKYDYFRIDILVMHTSIKN
mmetsp:Transcript_36545/g.71876  ORF Transcript_36545/g.71876 Transcript_36545/m.71876 type:complete len:92 (-) Transcript_36545:10-285(-)